MKSVNHAKLVRGRRLELKMTQTELAERLGVTLRAVQYWEAGQRPPSASVLKLLETITSENGVK